MKTYRRIIKLLFVLIIIYQCLWFSNALAADTDYKIWTSQEENVAIDKIWKIKFNHSLDESTLYDNINVVQAVTNERLKITIDYDESNNSITIKPLNYYNHGNEYILFIGTGVKSSKGSNLKQGIRFDFSVKAEENRDSNSLLQEVFNDPGTKINNPQEYYDALRYALANFKSQVTLNISNYNSKDYSLEIANKVVNDNPILNYGYRGTRASISSYASTGPAVMDINFNYDFTKERMEYMKKASENKAKEIISKVLKTGMSDLEKELALHDYVVNNAKYDARLYTDNMPSESYLDYGVLIEGVGVCDSYARAMYRLLNTAGIESIYVIGDGVSGGQIIPHAWNIVKIQDNYYQLDATWNDPVLSSGGDELSYAYFNVTDEKLSKDHIWDNSKYPKSTDDRFSYLQDMSYPITSGQDIYYSSNSDNNRIYKISIDGTNKEKILNDRALFISIYDEWIYFSNYSYGGYIYRVRKDGTGKTKLNNRHSTNLRIENGVLYYTDYETNIDKTMNI